MSHNNEIITNFFTCTLNCIENLNKIIKKTNTYYLYSVHFTNKTKKTIHQALTEIINNTRRIVN